MKGLAMIVMDALDVDILRAFNMDCSYDLYKENGNLLTCSSAPHTQSSNILIWSGKFREFYWVHNNTFGWVDPARREMRHRCNEPQPAQKDFIEGISHEEGVELVIYEDIKNTGVEFIWEIAESNGLDARAVQLPITLPPYSFNSKGETKAWFPYLPEFIEQNRRDKHKITMNALEDIANNQLDFYCTSFCSPDKPLHAPANKYATYDFPEKVIPKLDYIIRDIDKFCCDNDIGFAIFGDHGAPGAYEGQHHAKIYDQQVVIPRHGKHSVILGNMNDYPSYTEDLFDWMLEKLPISGKG